MPDPAGRARLIAEGPALATRPDGIEVTVEPVGGSATPIGLVVIASPAPRGSSIGRLP